MAWIESHQSLRSHRKTIRAASMLKVDKYKLVGHLHALWWWGLDNVEIDGVMGEITADEIADVAGWPVRKAKDFLNAIEAVGFLDRNDQVLSFHNWKRYTWRFYGLRDKLNDSSTAGAFGNHKRWHLDRGIIAPECEFCRGDVAPDVAPDVGAMVGGDVVPESGSRIASDHSDQPTLLRRNDV